MTIEEIIFDLSNKYGEDFNWYMISSSSSKEEFVEELKKEIGKDHFLYAKNVRVVAKCTSNDDVLFVSESENGKDIYYIFHLTYSYRNSEGFPRYEEYVDVNEVKERIEETYIKDFM